MKNRLHPKGTTGPEGMSEERFPRGAAPRGAPAPSAPALAVHFFSQTRHTNDMARDRSSSHFSRSHHFSQLLVGGRSAVPTLTARLPELAAGSLRPPAPASARGAPSESTPSDVHPITLEAMRSSAPEGSPS